MEAWNIDRDDEPGTERESHTPDPARDRPPRLTQAGVNRRVRQAIPYATVLALSTSTLASAASGYPGHQHLPGIALNSGALFYIERAVVFFAGLMVALTLLARGLMVELPLKLGFGTGSLEYGEEFQRVAGDTWAATVDLQTWTREVDGKLAQLESAVQKTTVLAAATAREVHGRQKPVAQTEKPLDPGRE